MTKIVTTRLLFYSLLLACVLFAFTSIVVGSILHVYALFWWWDDMLHAISGILIGLVGLLVLYAFNAKRVTSLNPWFVALFVFCFSMTVGVLWEFFEFSMDYFFGTAMQQWSMPPSAIVIGKSYQGMGLRDTMGDLMDAGIGTSIAAVSAFFAHTRAHKVVLDVAQRMFPWIKPSQKNILKRDV